MKIISELECKLIRSWVRGWVYAGARYASHPSAKQHSACGLGEDWRKEGPCTATP